MIKKLKQVKDRITILNKIKRRKIMRKNRLFVAFLLMATSVSLAFSGCNFFTPSTSSTDSSVDSSMESSSVVTPTLTLSEETLAMDVYDVVWLTATTTDTEEDVVWTTSDADKATVDQNSRVQAKAAGMVTITATA